MTKNIIADYQKRRPTAEQVETYTRSECELRQRFLRGILDVNDVLALLQQAMELRKNFIDCDVQPEIPDWADREKPIIKHIPGGIVDATQFATVVVHKNCEEYLDGEEFVARAQALPRAMNACAFDFYAKYENQKYLPENVDIIVFANTEFCFLGIHCVGCLCRNGSMWDRDVHRLDNKFHKVSQVAVCA